MDVLKGLSPERVFYYFEQIARIPHGSGNTKAVSDYICAAGKELGLECRQDELNNVILIKEASAGYENAPAVMLQGHMDMVCEKESGVEHDFTKDPLNLRTEGDEIFAEGTTLGGDDGIAVAYMLALLEDKKLSHPRLECVITVDEETGMEGAEGIDLSGLEAKYLLNLDSEEEGIFLASCAGGLRFNLDLPVKRERCEGNCVCIRIDGLTGGHSGGEIHKGRANANVLLGRLLNSLAETVEFRLVSLEGGTKDNAITRSAKAVLKTRSDRQIIQKVKDLAETYRREYALTDPQMEITAEAFMEEAEAMDRESQKKVLFALLEAPYGVQAMSNDVEGLVESSLNLGIMNTAENSWHISYSIRSSVESRKEWLKQKLTHLADFLGASHSETGDYPGWEFVRESGLRNLMCQVFEEMYGKKPQVEAIHAGLECGLLLNKRPGMYAVSIGPDMKDIHTPQERLSISSTARVYDFLKKVLERIH